MAWEQRGRQVVYVRKSRMGGRVVNEYFSGPAATLAAAQDERDRFEQRQKREAMKQIRADLESADSLLAEVDQLTRALTGGVLLAGGFHTHRRQWRARRG
jgi:hypothetical protein